MDQMIDFENDDSFEVFDNNKTELIYELQSGIKENEDDDLTKNSRSELYEAGFPNIENIQDLSNNNDSNSSHDYQHDLKLNLPTTREDFQNESVATISTNPNFIGVCDDFGPTGDHRVNIAVFSSTSENEISSDFCGVIVESNSLKDGIEQSGDLQTRNENETSEPKNTKNARVKNRNHSYKCPVLDSWVLFGFALLIITVFSLWFFNSGIYLLFGTRMKQSER